MNEALYQRLVALPDEYPGLEGIERDLFYLMGCGKFEQFCTTFRGILYPQKYCSFCRPEITRNKPLFHTTAWYAKENDFRGTDSLAMYLIIPNWHHTGGLGDLSEHDWQQIGELIRGLCGRQKLKGGGLVARFGDPHYHSGTVPHFHINLISPNGLTERRETLSKPPGDRAENYGRLLAHRDMLVEKGGLDFLFPTVG